MILHAAMTDKLDILGQYRTDKEDWSSHVGGWKACEIKL